MRNQSLAHLLMGALFLSLMACASGGSGGGDGSTDGGGPNTYYALTDGSADALAATYTNLAGVELVVSGAGLNRLTFQEPSNSHVIRETSGTWSYSGTNPSPASLSDTSMSDRSVYGTYTVTGASYDYVQSYTQTAASGTAVRGIIGLVTDASEMASLNGEVTYTGTAEGTNYLATGGGMGGYGTFATCCVGIATVTANFASNSVDVAITTDPDATGTTTEAVIVNVTGMAIEGNGFSGGTIMVDNSTDDYTSNYTSAQGYFYGPASDGGPAEVGGIISGNGLDPATGVGLGFFYTFTGSKDAN